MEILKWMLGATCLLTGCTILSPTHYASNDKQQYMKSQNGSILVVPPPLSTNNISDFYQLPDQKQPTKVGIVPPNE